MRHRAAQVRLDLLERSRLCRSRKWWWYVAGAPPLSIAEFRGRYRFLRAAKNLHRGDVVAVHAKCRSCAILGSVRLRWCRPSCDRPFPEVWHRVTPIGSAMEAGIFQDRKSVV